MVHRVRLEGNFDGQSEVAEVECEDVRLVPAAWKPGLDAADDGQLAKKIAAKVTLTGILSVEWGKLKGNTWTHIQFSDASGQQLRGAIDRSESLASNSVRFTVHDMEP